MAMTTTTTGPTTDAPHPDRSVTTADPAAIRAWAEARGGRPAAVEPTGGADDVVVIRIAFPGAPDADDAKLTEITWDAFFETFEAAGLALVYQEETTSNFNRLVKRDAPAPAKPATKKATAKKPTAKKPAAKKATAKKVPPKVPAAKKATAKKAAAKRVPVAKKSAKKAATKKAAAKKPPAKKASGKKASAKKPMAKKVPPSRGFRGR